MTRAYVSRYPELSLSSLDPATWKTVPEIAALTGCLAGDIGTVLAHFGLRWKGPNGRWTNHYATEKALRDGVAVRVDLSEYEACWRWNYPKLMELFSQGKANERQ